MKRFEYTYIVTPAESASKRLEELNIWGEQGWRVVGQEQKGDQLAFLLEREVTE